MNDFDCDHRGAGAVCVKSKGQQPQCAPGWYLYDGKCYSRILGNIVYKEAVEICDAFKRGTIISAPEHYGVFVSETLIFNILKDTFGRYILELIFWSCYRISCWELEWAKELGWVPLTSFERDPSSQKESYDTETKTKTANCHSKNFFLFKKLKKYSGKPNIKRGSKKFSSFEPSLRFSKQRFDKTVMRRILRYNNSNK